MRAASGDCRGVGEKTENASAKEMALSIGRDHPGFDFSISSKICSTPFSSFYTWLHLFLARRTKRDTISFFLRVRLYYHTLPSSTFRNPRLIPNDSSRVVLPIVRFYHPRTSLNPRGFMKFEIRRSRRGNEFRYELGLKETGCIPLIGEEGKKGRGAREGNGVVFLSRLFANTEFQFVRAHKHFPISLFLPTGNKGESNFANACGDTPPLLKDTV